TTGNVGRRSVRAVEAHPDLQLVGCYAWSPDKVGRDVGELCGIGPVGVTATDDIEALLALNPDCVVYNPMWQNPEELVRILAAGVNVVSTAAFINGRGLGPERDRIVEACQRGGSSMFGTGISPGFVELIGIAAAGISDRVDKITISEGSDTTLYDSPATELPCGFGRPIDDPELPGMAAQGTAVFGEAVALVADALGVELDEIVCEAEYARTTEDVVMDSWTISAGCVAGVAASWQGKVGDRTIVELNVRWKKGQTLDPDWTIEEGHVIQIDGLPTVRVRLEYLPPPDFEATTFAEFMVLGMIMTAMPAIHAIPSVVAAPPGIVTYADLPLPLPRGVVSG
ncbi:MAG: dihydrodipicolinate reductase, partial [Acidimicrobiia bacterium]|nr:dihydrodipicolinate reductase [Acidimicrobiia bacterium]